MGTIDEGLEAQIRNIEERYGKPLSEWIAIVRERRLESASSFNALGGEKTGPNPTDRGKSGVKRSVLTEGHGVPIGVVIEGANRHAMKLACSGTTTMSARMLRPSLDASQAVRCHATGSGPRSRSLYFAGGSKPGCLRSAPHEPGRQERQHSSKSAGHSEALLATIRQAAQQAT